MRGSQQPMYKIVPCGEKKKKWQKQELELISLRKKNLFSADVWSGQLVFVIVSLSNTFSNLFMVPKHKLQE